MSLLKASSLVSRLSGGAARHLVPRWSHSGPVTGLVGRAAASEAAAADRAVRVGDRMHGYVVRSVVPVEEFSLTAVMLEHDTGAQHLHIERDDANNVFGVSFRTTPRDSTGVPHILEHLSLCGSAQFPVRDPFFKMLNRSLSTFMNAFTASDWTMYPFSTQNPRDYDNLMSVYLDAAFFPKLSEHDFRQEGWRLEHENAEDSNSPIVYKGIVFNEMKGVFSSADQLFATRNQCLLLPSHTYGVVSGGDPTYIPDLTHKQLREFHARHYHPSNARFYTYGSFPLEPRLRRINELCLSRFSRATTDTAVTPEPRWTSPREASIRCSPDPMSPDPEKSCTVAVTYLLREITDVHTSCALSILCSLLTDGEKSPFYQSLIESGLGSDYAPTTGYNGYTRESSFSVGLQRISAKDVDKVKDIIGATLDKVIQTGFESERIEVILHKIELSLKHQSEKFGLNLGISVLPGWTHDGDPTQLMQVNDQVAEFKRQLAANPRFLQDLVAKYFKNNPHRLTLVMTPDEGFNAKQEAMEQTKLSAAVSALSAEGRTAVYENGLELARLQAETQDLSCLPTLHVADIERAAPSVELKRIAASGVPVQLCVQPTNGITYFRAVSNLVTLPDTLKPYVPLFCDVVTKMGAGGLDYKELSEQIELRTGGLDARVNLHEHPSQQGLYEQSVLFSSHSLDRNLSAMFDLWTSIFTGVLWYDVTSLDMSDKDRLRTLLMMSAAEASAGLSEAGHRYAMTHSASSLTPCAATKELLSGMTQIELMKKLAESLDVDSILVRLQEIASHILSASNMRCSLNMTSGSCDEAVKRVEGFVSGLSQRPSTPPGTSLPSFYSKNETFSPRAALVHFELPFQVHYVGKSVSTVPYSHPDYASLRILAKLLSTRYLHREIREKGGAYGGGASSDSGLFHFYSYRDPSLPKTLEAFADSLAWAGSGDFLQQDIDESKLSVFSQVDSPVPPGSKGMRQFLHGVDDVSFQRHREQLLAVTKDDIMRVNDKYLQKAAQNASSLSVLGPTHSVTSQNPRWTVRKAN